MSLSLSRRHCVLPTGLITYNGTVLPSLLCKNGRPQSIPRFPWSTSRRWSSLKAGENKSGHINAGTNEGIFFFDNIFPLRLPWLTQLPFINADKSIPKLLKRVDSPNLAAADTSSIISRALPKSLPVKLLAVIPRIKEGGAFVKFSHEPATSKEELEARLKRHLKEHPLKPWFNPFRRVRAFLVQGRPWIEDMFRLPTSRLKVEFFSLSPDKPAIEPPPQEVLFSLFRRFGKITDIIPQPADSKILPRYATIDFRIVRCAAMAKNCMHGYSIQPGESESHTGSLLKISFEQKSKSHWTRDWLFSHPRLVIPALAAVLAAVTVAIFDPIRTFFIKTHINHAFHFEGNFIGRWFRSQVVDRAHDMFGLGAGPPSDNGLNVLFEDRQSIVKQIKSWLIETADTFIVVQGPRGSGKLDLIVEQALQDRKHKLVVDCKPIQEARGDSAKIAATAAQVGYRPVFSWLNSFSSLIDLAAQGTIGTKAGFSETLDTHLAKIFGNSATALRQLALSTRKKSDKDFDLSDDEYLEAHPERRPVVVIDNFLHKTSENSVVYDKIAEWAATLTSTSVAHVIVLTNDVSYSKSLSKALPNRVFRQAVLSDFSPETTKSFVIKQLETDADDAVGAQPLTESQRKSYSLELDEAVSILGGRIADIQFLVRRIKAGETPKKAAQAIVEQAASEILKMFVLDGDSPDRKWTPQQAWLLISKLSRSDTLKYHELLLSDHFKDDGQGVLQALENAELIAISDTNGRPSAIKPGKPVYQAAFSYLAQDQALRSQMELSMYKQLIGIDAKSLEKCENELKLLQETNARPSLTSRTQWLLNKCESSQRKIEEYENQIKLLKKTLASSY